MTTDKNTESKYDRLLLVSGIFGFIAILLCATFAIIKYIETFEDKTGLSNSQEVWGQFGDFVGGLLNPAIGALTVYLLIVSVYMQRRELRNSIDEMRSSNRSLAQHDIRQTFFTWLESYREIVGGATGRGRLKAGFEKFLGSQPSGEMLRQLCPEHEADDALIQYRCDGYVPNIARKQLKEYLLDAWSVLYDVEAHHIGSMYRTLYRLIVWIHKEDQGILTVAQKYQYISIARAQLSDIEIDYLFFNGFTEQGKAFVEVINTYALLDNINLKNKPALQFLKIPHFNPYEESAFNSEMAKKKLGILDKP